MFADWGGKGIGPPPPANPELSPMPNELEANTTATTNTRIAIFMINSLQIFALQNFAPRKLTIDYMRNGIALQQFKSHTVSRIRRHLTVPMQEFSYR
jgi:hypothetical protein